MEFLRLLESIRTPFLDKLMLLFTYLGEETVFLLVALVIFWCVSKRKGYYILAVGFFGTILSQFLKMTFRVPRPWVKDPSFTIVESARSGANGYSFPSGHTQNAVGTFGSIALYTKKAWLRWSLVALALLVSFSRLYVGVHTPLDVGVALLCALFFVFALYPLLMRGEQKPKTMLILLGCMLACSVAYILYVNLYPFPADMDPVNRADGVKNGWSLFGALLALCISYFVDEKKLHFDERAPFWGQVLKIVLGLAGILGIRFGLKALFSLLGDDVLILSGVRYFCMVFFAATLWPMTFPWFQKLGKKVS